MRNRQPGGQSNAMSSVAAAILKHSAKQFSSTFGGALSMSSTRCYAKRRTTHPASIGPEAGGE